MKYLSEKTKQAYESVKELEEAEKKFDAKTAADTIKLEEKKADAKKVEDAYKHSLEVRKQASDLINTADDAYIAARNMFINKYGCYHQSYYSTGGEDGGGITICDNNVGVLLDILNIISSN